MVDSVQIDKSVIRFESLPKQFTEITAIDDKTETIYVQKSTMGDPLFMSWMREVRSGGFKVQAVVVGLDQISKLRDAGHRIETDVDKDQKFKKWATDIIVKASEYQCSDIHFMMRGAYTEIQFTINGGLRSYQTVKQEDGMSLTRAIFQGLAKVRSASFQPLEYQDAQIAGEDLPSSAGLTSVRIVRGPCYPTEKEGGFMTLRLQYSGARTKSPEFLPPLPLPRFPDGDLKLETMGYTPEQVANLTRLFDSPNGLVIFTGPTGSGKTTSMYECLQETARQKPYRRLVTAEDPVEYPMPWAVQLSITDGKNDKEKGEAFSERIRTMLRMAPKVILLGELRGPEVSSSALEAALTGHLVITTLHVTDPFLFVERLEMMDPDRLNRKVFCDHKIVRGVVGQRLVPKLCKKCSIPLEAAKEKLSPQKIKDLSTWGPLDYVRLQGDGCEECGMSGSIGRFAVAEIIVTDQQLMSDFIHHGSDTARKNYRSRAENDRSMLETVIQHILRGEVDPRRAEDEVDLIVPKDQE